MNPLVPLPASNLKALKGSFSDGALKYGITKEAFYQCGIPTETTDEIISYLNGHSLSATGICSVIDTILETRTHSVSLSQSLVVTGPDTKEIANLRTQSRFSRIVEHAQKELMLATFALYQGDKILAPIHEAMLRTPKLEVSVILNVARKYSDKTLSAEVLEAYKQELFKRHWLWPEKPKFYYYPAALETNTKERSAMHAKFLIADEERCFITSANFTDAAQKRNIEVGVELNHSSEPKALSQYFKSLMHQGVLKTL